MTWRAGIHGYAARWGVVTAPLTRSGAPHLSRPARFRRGCFDFTAATTPVWFMHRDAQCVGTGAAVGLEIWEDAYGLAFAFQPPATAYDLVCGIAQGRYDQCSVGFQIEASADEGGGVDAIISSRLSEISICPRGACPGAICWHSGNGIAALTPAARAVLPGWLAGRTRSIAA